MALSLEFFDAAGSCAAEGVFIPVADLPGVQAAELAAAQPANTKESKVILALLNALSTGIPATTLGLTAVKGSPAGAGADVLNCPFTFTWQRVLNLANNETTPAPVPVAGANAGIGDVALVDIFPNSAKVAAAGAVAGAGVVINTAQLQNYSAITQATINPAADSRDWIMALMDAISTDSTVRSATVASGVVSRTRGTIGAATIPAAWTATTAPASGLDAADLPVLGLVTRSNAVAVQVALNQITQVFEVRSVVS
jgi:hypothetical protein